MKKLIDLDDKLIAQAERVRHQLQLKSFAEFVREAIREKIKKDRKK